VGLAVPKQNRGSAILGSASPDQARGDPWLEAFGGSRWFCERSLLFFSSAYLPHLLHDTQLHTMCG